MISESEYVDRASTELEFLIRALDSLQSDEIDCELENDIITIEVDEDTEYVINSHRAARQIWMAANRTAWHFDWDEETSTWVAHKSGDELWKTVRAVLAPHLDGVDLERKLVR